MLRRWHVDRALPALVVALLALAATMGTVAVLQLGVDMSFRPLFKADANDSANARFEAIFGQPSGAYLIAMVRADDLQAEGIRSAIDDAAEKIRSLKHIAQVISIADLPAQAASGSDLLSEDGKTTRIMAQVELPLADLAGRRPVIAAFKNAVRSALPTDEVSFTGVSVVEDAYAQLVLRYLVLGVALTLTAVLAVLVWYSGLAGALVSLAGVTVAVPIALGFMAIAGHDITIVTSMVPTMVLILGVADAIHMQGTFHESLERSASRRDAICQMIRRMFRPCVATTLTTVAGTLALLTAEVQAIATFGVCVAVGVCTALVANQVLVPFLTAHLPLAPPRRLSLDWALAPAPRQLAVVLFIVVSIASAGTAAISSNQHFNAELAEEHPVRLAQAQYEAAFGGFLGPELFFEDAPSTAELAVLESRFLDHSDVLSVTRLANGNAAALAIRTQDIGSEAASDFVAWLESSAASALGPDNRGAVVGQWWLAQQGMDALIGDATRAFSVAFLTVLPFLLLVTRRAPLLALSIAANLLPVLVGLGFMGYADIPLRIGTALVLAVALGVAVDDSVHMAARLERELAAGKRPREAARDAVRGCGPALVVTTVALATGFASMWINPLLAIRDMGAVAAVIVVTALLADLVLLPACIARLREPATAALPRVVRGQ